MHCSDARGEQYAAQEALAVSEQQLQRVKQKGCEVASASDRAVFTLPNYKALPWPVVSGPDITLEFDSNNMHLGRESINAAEFTEPFVGGPALNRSIHKPAYGPTGTSLAGSGNLLATEAVSFSGSEPPEPALYQQLAASIKMNLDEQPAVAFAQTAPASLSQQKLGTPLETTMAAAGTPLATSQQVSLPSGKNASIYGSSSATASSSMMSERLHTALKGAVYDLAHYGDITQEHLDKERCSCKLSYVFTRDGRGPFLSVVCLSVLLLIAIAMVSISGASN